VVITVESRYSDGMDGRQIRAARALLGWNQADLCKAAGISRPTLNDLENETGDPRRSSIAAVEDAFRDHGVLFTDDGTTVGVKARK